MIKIFVCNDCSPEFVALQFHAFEKYLQEPFEYHILNCDPLISKTPEKSIEVTHVCNHMGIPVIYVPRDPEMEAYWLTLAPGHRLFNSDGRFVRGIGGDTFNYMLQWTWQRYLLSQRGKI